MPRGGEKMGSKRKKTKRTTNKENKTRVNKRGKRTKNLTSTALVRKKDVKMKFKYKHPKIALILKIFFIMFLILFVIGAGVVIGGVIEPVGAYPVIIEDNAFIGAGSQITEGTIVKKGAVIGAGVTITGSTPVYDNVNGTIILPNENGQIIIPENAVVIPGSRKVESKIEGVELSKNVPIIIKYGAKIELEDLLR